MNDTIKIDVNILDRYGQTPLDDAIRHKNKTLQTMLKARDGRIGAEPPFHQAQKATEAKVAKEQVEQVLPPAAAR